jgi:hypothetical protein
MPPKKTKTRKKTGPPQEQAPEEEARIVRVEAPPRSTTPRSPSASPGTSKDRETTTPRSRKSSVSSDKAPSEPDSPGGLPDLDVQGPEQTQIPLGRRKKGTEGERHFLFTRDVEDDLIEWWRSHDFLYNNTLPDFLDKAKKDRTIEAKAKEIGCTSEYNLYVILTMCYSVSG